MSHQEGEHHVFLRRQAGSRDPLWPTSELRVGLLTHPGLWPFLVLTAAPVLASLLYATAYTFGAAGWLSRGLTLEHWRRVAGSHEVWAALGLSAYVAVMVVVLTLLLALPLALVLRKRLQSGLLSYLLALPMTVPGTVAALLALHVLGSAGLLSRLAFRLGLTHGMADFPVLVHDAALAGVIACHVALAVPFFTLLFAELHVSEQLEALGMLAASLGAGRWQRLRLVTLPVLLAGALPSFGLLFVLVFGSFEIPWLLGRQAPQMLSVLTYRKYALFDLAQKPEAFILALGYTVAVFGLAAAVTWRRGRPA